MILGTATPGSEGRFGWERSHRGDDWHHRAWEALKELLPVEDLTESARVEHHAGEIRRGPVNNDEALCAGPITAAARTFHRQLGRNLLLAGRKRVDKTSLIRELARRAAAGEIPFLAGHRFLWIDCQNVGPEDSRACLESIFTAVMSEIADRDAATIPGPPPPSPLPVSRERGVPLVLCLDGLGALLKRPNGGTNKPLLRALISRAGIRLIGILSRWEYNDLIGGDADMADLFTRIEIEEPGEQTALAIARRQAARLSAEFGLRIDDRVVERTVALASTFVLNECHPAKSIRILRRVCEDADYDRTQLGLDRTDITVEDVVRAIAEKTGIPPHTIAGESDEVDFEAALRDAVVGQDEAVRQVHAARAVDAAPARAGSMRSIRELLARVLFPPYSSKTATPLLPTRNSTRELTPV